MEDFGKLGGQTRLPIPNKCEPDTDSQRSLNKPVCMANNRGTKLSITRRIGLLAIAALLIAGVCGGAVYGYWAILDHRFWTVADGQVYRSAAMSPEKLEDKVREYGIRAVIDLRRHSDDQVAAERSVLAKLDVKHFHLPSKQIPSDRTVEAFLEIMSHNAYRPVLIHCKDGEGRAPLFSAIYLIEHEGRSNDQARRASRILSFVGNFSPTSKKGVFLHNYAPRTLRENPQSH